MLSAPAPAQGRITMLAEGCTGLPRISGNGKVVVWSQELPSGHAAVFKYQDGSVTQLTEDGYDCGNPCVSDDGSVIAYSRYVPGDQTHLGNFDVYQYCDGKSTPVATGQGNELSVAISGDGRTIAFDDDISGSFSTWRIGKWHDGTTTFLTHGKPDAEFPIVAKDSGRVYFREFKDGRSRTAGEASDGTVGVAVQAPGNTIKPDVSADGSTFLWTDDSRPNNQLLCARDGAITTVASDAGVDYTWGRLSGDGSKMVYGALDHRVPDPSKPVVSLLLADGQGQTQLAVSDAQGMPIIPDLSRDGQAVTWEWVDSQDTEHTRIYLYQQAPSPQPVVQGSSQDPAAC
jgi:Tol biopolymer transport system component